jgi:hypothetical protein
MLLTCRSLLLCSSAANCGSYPRTRLFFPHLLWLHKTFKSENLKKKKKRFILCVRVHCHCLQTHQKRVSDPITDGCEPPRGCWELNSGLLEEESVLLTTEPSLQLHSENFQCQEFWATTEMNWTLGMMTQPCNFSTEEIDTAGWWVEIQP